MTDFDPRDAAADAVIEAEVAVVRAAQSWRDHLKTDVVGGVYLGNDPHTLGLLQALSQWELADAVIKAVVGDD